MAKLYEDKDEFLMRRLRETGLVDSILLDELVEVQRSFWKPFGRVAITLGFMRIVQVAKVLSFQATHPDRNFGECARCLGFLRSHQIEKVIAYQRELIPSLTDILVAEMVLELHEVTQLVLAPSPQQKSV